MGNEQDKFHKDKGFHLDKFFKKSTGDIQVIHQNSNSGYI